MEWLIIILLVIFIIMVFTLKPVPQYEKQYQFEHQPQTQSVQCNTIADIKPLVMLPNLNPTSLIQH